MMKYPSLTETIQSGNRFSTHFKPHLVNQQTSQVWRNLIT